MGKAQMIHEAAIARKGTVHPWPGLEIITETKQPWYIRAAIWTGVIMATPETPKGWSLNPATVTLALLIASLIAGGSYYIGGRDAEMRSLQEQIKKAADDAAKAKQLETYNAGSVDAMKGHANSNTEKKK
jgi:hypothetical protein